LKYPDYFHFFSWHTKVSIELPVGFEEEAEIPEEYRAIYADDLDPDDERGAKILTKALKMPEVGEETLLQIASNSALIPGNSVISGPEKITIDHLEAVKQYIMHKNPETEEETLRCEVFAGAADLLFMIIGVCEMKRKDDYFPVFETAVGSVRFIIL